MTCLGGYDLFELLETPVQRPEEAVKTGFSLDLVRAIV
jgi:hypothetical protein